MNSNQQKYLARSNPEILITLKDLNYFYGEKQLRRQVLFDINLQIHAGEIVILSGPSGSGKTTLLTLIGGLRVLQEGSIRLLGTELFKASSLHLALMRRQIGFIFQAHNLHPSLTATENVMMGLGRVIILAK